MQNNFEIMDDENNESGSSGDSFTETEEVGWGSRLKDSIGSAVGGGVLFLASFVILFSNEGCSVKNAKAIKEGAKSVISLPSVEKIDPANNAKLVHFSGKTELGGKLTDTDTGISVDAIKLTRSVEMYQWHESKETKTEKKIGGGETKTHTYTYKKEWSSSLIDSSGFKKPEGRRNPASMPLGELKLINEDIKVGAFSIPSGLASGLSDADDLKITPQQNFGLSAQFATLYKVQPDGSLYKGTPENPAIGDVRIFYETVPAQEVSIIAAQNGNTVAQHQTTEDRTTFLIASGNVTADAMFKTQAEGNKMMTWVLRLVGFMAMAFGLYMVFKPLATVADVLPFLGNLLEFGLGIFSFLIALFLSLITIAIAWIFYRPLLGIALLVLGVGGILSWKYYAARKKTVAT